MTEQDVIDKVNQRPQFKTPIAASPRPHKISVARYGDHASYCKGGHRIWGFDSARGRDRFAIDYARHEVQYV